MISRVCTKRFALASGEGEAADHAERMRKAVRLLDAGWQMEAIAGWVLVRWGTLKARSAALTLRPGRVTTAPAADAVCPICRDGFEDPDVVANLDCGHNVHAVCGGSNKLGRTGEGGMCAWMSRDHVSCPCCRADVRP
jgi:hypothetical protein